MRKGEFKNQKLFWQTGTTFLELLIVVAIIAALGGITLAVIKPGERLAKGRNTQRTADMTVILNAIGSRMADNRGVFETGCASGAIPTTATTMASSAGNYNIAPCLVPAYLEKLPYDPKAAGAQYTDVSNYNTGYQIVKDATTGRITLTAPGAEAGETISVVR